MTTNTNSIGYAVDADGVATLTMDVPGAPVNAVGSRFMADLAAAIDRAAADAAAKGILLVSGKDTFLAGADLKEMDSNGARPAAALSPAERLDLQQALSDALRKLETCGKPVAVVINGVAAGAGLELALACHYRVAVDDRGVVLGLPESQVGLIPGSGGTQRLPRLIGVEKAVPLMLQGKLVPAGQAKDLGIVDAVLPAEQARAEAERWLLEEGDPVQPWDKKGYRVPGGLPTASAEVGRVFFLGNTMTRAKTFGTAPAQSAILAAVWEGIRLPFDTAVRLEGKYFQRIFEDPTSKAIIRTMFVSKKAADKLVARPAGIPKAQIRRLGIAGAGTMGAGIALAAAKAGLGVVLLDTTEDKARAGKGYAEKRLNRDVEKGRSTVDKRDAILGRIEATADFTAFADVDFVVEAVFESESVKREVYAEIEKHLPEGVVLASNTSALPITGLADLTQRAADFIGTHFFSPAERMPLVEVIRGRATSDRTLAHALDLAQILRKTPIVVNDNWGFFTSRFIGSFLTESMRMVQEGVLPALVENGARMVGMPQGALTVTDAIGIDVGRAALIEKVRADENAKAADYELGAFLVGKYDRRGRKNGKGFYDYGADGSKRLWAGLSEAIPPLPVQPTIEEVQVRILYAQLAEGARAFAEGVLLGPADGDLGATLGVGFPAHLGGPFVAMDQIGITEVLARLDRLRDAHGDKFAAPELLRAMARNGWTFYGPMAVVSPGAPESLAAGRSA
ncbi:3-hydroxyacyl-CoA dehydrogenase NAD-binding domain-containing protein [Nocardia bovistercoris]|uniref:Enoyl-CoA hydratase/isomerase family protein n=1 Tax=Nocardia bovistercoris TaxID=2785916 RepID=A0A931IFV9_9NOCA|nr:3-hydroxyacyl-CoA dehydrogenase NAD-binding domain-containing protein [Nocardia bovistercoris]MBH0779803.1 enoyl-CoA hydratase/isomerase family protein [Nocardia bovistercoris]